jgi:hypothetical protein
MIKKKTHTKRPKNTRNTGTNIRTKKSTASRNKSPRKSQGMDPDRLALSKNDILEFCDRVIKKWQQDPTQNTNVPAMFAVRTGVLFSDEVSLSAIWSEIISWVYQLLYENAQAQARHENQEWAKTFAKIKSKE